MTLNGKAFIVGAYEHPTRKADELSVVRLHADVAKGALDDAGLTKHDIDGYFCAGDAPGLGTTTMAEYLGLKLRHVDSTECGGSAPILHVAHAAQAIAAGHCNVALITLAGRPRAAMAEAAAKAAGGKGKAPLALKPPDPDAPELASARRASSSHGSRSRRRTTRSTTRMRCCAMSSRSTRSSARRWSPIRCTGSTAA
jgi:acetyl-CoA C-acetyltransferase